MSSASLRHRRHNPNPMDLSGEIQVCHMAALVLAVIMSEPPWHLTVVRTLPLETVLTPLRPPRT